VLENQECTQHFTKTHSFLYCAKMVNQEKLQAFLAAFPQTTSFWVAFSGGLDSQVLLHALSQVVSQTRLRALHIDHGWHAQAKVWAKACQAYCVKQGIACEVMAVNAQPQPGESPEAAARQARYHALATRLQPGDALLTAHHQDDQAETVLLQLLRGSGLNGLAAMSEVMPFAQGFLLRPFLTATRADLLAYAQQHSLSWIEDHSNSDLRFQRNFIRHQVIPLLKQRWPALHKTLARVAVHSAEAQQLLDERAQEDYQRVRGDSEHQLRISTLLKLSPARQRNCLRYWFKQQALLLPSQQQLQQILALLHSQSDARPRVNWGAAHVRRYRDQLYCFARAFEPIAFSPIQWNLQRALTLPHGQLNVECRMGQGLVCQRIDTSAITVRLRCGGERFHPQGRVGSHPLKKLFQEWGVPPWERDQIPLIFHKETLLAVPNYGIDAQFAAQADELGYWIQSISVPPT
jgi:tRNA(Ile)-lysidine synthase